MYNSSKEVTALERQGVTGWQKRATQSTANFWHEENTDKRELTILLHVNILDTQNDHGIFWFQLALYDK